MDREEPSQHLLHLTIVSCSINIIAHDDSCFLPAGFTYAPISIDQGDCVYSVEDASVSCTIGALPSGASVTGVLSATAAGEGAVTTLF